MEGGAWGFWCSDCNNSFLKGLVTNCMVQHIAKTLNKPAPSLEQQQCIQCVGKTTSHEHVWLALLGWVTENLSSQNPDLSSWSVVSTKPVNTMMQTLVSTATSPSSLVGLASAQALHLVVDKLVDGGESLILTRVVETLCDAAITVMGQAGGSWEGARRVSHFLTALLKRYRRQSKSLFNDGAESPSDLVKLRESSDIVNAWWLIGENVGAVLLPRVCLHMASMVDTNSRVPPDVLALVTCATNMAVEVNRLRLLCPHHPVGPNYGDVSGSGGSLRSIVPILKAAIRRPDVEGRAVALLLRRGMKALDLTMRVEVMREGREESTQNLAFGKVAMMTAADLLEIVQLYHSTFNLLGAPSVVDWESSESFFSPVLPRNDMFLRRCAIMSLVNLMDLVAPIPMDTTSAQFPQLGAFLSDLAKEPRHASVRTVLKPFEDNDAALVKLASTLVSAFQHFMSNSHRVPLANWPSPLQALFQSMSPVRMFHEIIRHLSFDCSLMVDFVLSADTEFLPYLLQTAKLLCNNPPGGEEDVASALGFDLLDEEELLDTLECIRQFCTALGDMFHKGTVPFNPTPLLRRLRLLTAHIEETLDPKAGDLE